jgi:predicted O-linked N-acetylglucosamine transferase (SPINDLY family)
MDSILDLLDWLGTPMMMASLAGIFFIAVTYGYGRVHLTSNLITDSEDSYIELAVNLGQNLSSRQEYTTHILQKMQRPSFLDSHGFGK